MSNHHQGVSSVPTKVLDRIKIIEKYQGEAYQVFDEVGEAIHEIKAICAKAVYEAPKKKCDSCEKELELNEFPYNDDTCADCAP